LEAPKTESAAGKVPLKVAIDEAIAALLVDARALLPAIFFHS